MSKTIRVSDDYHAYLKAHNREGETMEETLRRLTGGPRPEDVAGILSEETAERIKERVERKRERGIESKADVRERFS
ncbi:antitoxin VapB family protein [Halomarina litorea]|uniref:antitoxin VapB family protein n=1 Tax=Halomarina litorea TaxID=2961595 RepID=UPI0020C58654|nr:antitoxin VapB family protein [Halomarina sp. BCD28]